MNATASNRYVVGVDLGGTHVRTAIAPIVGHGVGELDIVYRGPTPLTRREFAATIADAVEVAARRGEPTAVGVAIPGLVDDGRFVWAPNTDFLNGTIVDDLVDGLPVIAANDAHLSLLAETLTGAACGLDHAVLLAIGTGIGSAILADRSILRGHRGAACSGGWICAGPGDEPDVPPPSGSGWLERHASGSALDQLAEHLDPGADSYDVIDRARRRDPRALEALATATTALGTAIAAMVVTLAPQRVVISGGLSAAWDVLGPAVTETMKRHTPAHLQSTEIVAGRCGPHAALLGSLHAAQRGPHWWKDMP